MVSQIQIIIITFENVSELVNTVRSIDLYQSSKNNIVIIDGMTDKFLHHFKGAFYDGFENTNFQIISEPDKGIYDAYNKGIKIFLENAGEFITFLNSGDRLYDQNYWAEAVDYLEKNPEVDYVHADLIFEDLVSGNRVLSPRKEIGQGMTMMLPTAVFRKSVFEKVGLFSLDYKISSDYRLNALLVKHKLKGHYIQRPVVLMDGGGVSSNKELKAIEECQKILQELELYHGVQKFYFLKRKLKAWIRIHLVAKKMGRVVQIVRKCLPTES